MVTRECVVSILLWQLQLLLQLLLEEGEAGFERACPEGGMRHHHAGAEERHPADRRRVPRAVDDEGRAEPRRRKSLAIQKKEKKGPT